MRGGNVMLAAGALFMIAAAIRAASDGGSAGALVAIGAAFIAIGARQPKAGGSDAR